MLATLRRLFSKRKPKPLREPDIEDRLAAEAESVRRANFLPVSRHGLAEHGVTCPRCSELAVDPNDWAKIHAFERKTHTEEAVCCWNCGAFLLASPDDDIDPVRSDEEYDPDIYHRFVRPEGWTPPRQRVLDREIREGDWVVVWESFRTDNGTDLKDGEGRVSRIADGIATVIMAGFPGITAPSQSQIPVRALRVMVFERYRIGMRVRIKRGEGKGLEGTITAFKGGDLTIEVDGRRINTTQERVDRIDLE